MRRANAFFATISHLLKGGRTPACVNERLRDIKGDPATLNVSANPINGRPVPRYEAYMELVGFIAGTYFFLE